MRIRNAAALAGFLLPLLQMESALAQQPAPARSTGMKVTFGLKARNHGASWAGGVNRPEQIRGFFGWRVDDEDRVEEPRGWDLRLRMVAGNVAPKGIILDVLSPESQPVSLFSRRGDIDFTPADIPYGEVRYPGWSNGDVSIERVPVPRLVSTAEFEDDDPALLAARDGSYWLAWVGYKTRRRSEWFYDGADQVFLARSRDGGNWSRPEALTRPGDHFRVALGEDAEGGVWCVYSLQKRRESGNFDLFARRFDGRRWSKEQQLTESPFPDVFHRLASGGDGALHLVWMGFRENPDGGAPQSDILYKAFRGGAWAAEINVTSSPADDWAPAVAADSSGRAWIAWDAYEASAGRPADYGVFLRSVEASGELGERRAISTTPYAEMRAQVAVDGEDRVWVAWEEGGVNWGKDAGYQNPKHRIRLRQGGSRLYGRGRTPEDVVRRPRLAVLDGGRLLAPRAKLAESYPRFLRGELFQNPRLAVDGTGRVWVVLRHQLIAQGRNGGHIFDNYATTIAGGRWLPPILLPRSTGRQDTVLASAPGRGQAVVFAVVTDGRRLPIGLPRHHDVYAMVLDASALSGGEPRFEPFRVSIAPERPVPHPREDRALATIRGHRFELGGKRYKIIRGDLHRHTEISMDGAVDGSLWDCYRYALNAAGFDFLGVSDHNYGAWLDTDEPESANTDDEYQWWRTQKAADIFHVPGRFVPLYGYERSVNFPLGHRNIFHARRGVFSYRVPKLHIAERPDLIEADAQGLWAYLRATDGIGIPHTSGTVMGTDWRLRDDEVMPVTEIYQGDRNAYEEEGAPRAALSAANGPGWAGRKPFQKGLIWNALGAGHRMGFIASSDHFSTHISYANLIVPDRVTTREDIQEAFRLRRTYASTDNIVVEFSASETMQGGELTASSSPEFRIGVVGTAPILKIEVIKNNHILYTARPPGADPLRFTFHFRDRADFGGDFGDRSMASTSQIRNWDAPETGVRPRPEAAENYYYVRVIQSFSEEEPEAEGEIAWSSPIFVRVAGRE